MVKQVKPITEKIIKPEEKKLEVLQGNELDVYKELIKLQNEVKKNSNWRQLQQFLMCCSCSIVVIVLLISYMMFMGQYSY